MQSYALYFIIVLYFWEQEDDKAKNYISKQVSEAKRTVS